MPENKFLIGSNVSMETPEMLLGSAKQAEADGENVFMVYTGAPQNTQRKPVSELFVPEAHEYMKKNGIYEIVIHAPYVINLANSKNMRTFHFGVSFLKQEIKRADEMGADQIVLHPGSHVGQGTDAGIKQVIKGLNEALSADQNVQIAIETMAGKGTEVGTDFDQIAQIINGVDLDEKLSVCFDTCHTSDAGYDVKNDFDGVLKEFDEKIGLERLKVVHLNDSKNSEGSHKDRHSNIGFGELGFDDLNYIAHHPKLTNVPKILETPGIKINDNLKVDPHKAEIKMLKEEKFNPKMMTEIEAEFK